MPEKETPNTREQASLSALDTSSELKLQIATQTELF